MKPKNVELELRSSSPSNNSSSSAEDAVTSSSANSQDEMQAGSVTTYEDLLMLCGEAGWWQLQLFLLASFCGFLTALHNLVYAFIGASPEHWCELPDLPHLNTDQLKAQFIPSNGKGDYEQCLRYAAYNSSTSPWINPGNDSLVNPNKTESCPVVQFDTSIFQTTIVTDLNLVCGDNAWASLVQAMYMIGILVGSPILGALSDKIGRKRAILFSSIVFILAGPFVALAPNFTLLMIARFILGASSPGIYATSFVLVVENVGPSWRGLAGNLFCLPFALGYMVLPGVAYFFRDWRHLQLVLSAPSLLQILVCWFSPESPRWLLRKGRVLEAEAVLRIAAKTNNRRKRLPSNFHDLVKRVASNEKVDIVDSSDTWTRKFMGVVRSYSSLLRSPRIRRRTLVLYFSWLSISMVYYGVALNSPNLSADRYLYTFISGVLEIPSYLMVPPLIKVLGRRLVFSGFLLLCSISLLISLLFAQGSVFIVVLALIGKFLIGAAYALIYLYATELMPTLLRTYGVGTASMVGRIGSASAPFIVDLLGRDNKTVPTLVFGVVSLLAGLLSLLLPETRNKRLPETVRDVENVEF